MLKKGLRRILAAVSAAALVLGVTGCQKEENILDAEKPVKVTVWNYYSGYQMEAFEEMVSEFNETVGTKKGVIVESISQGSVNGLIEGLKKSVDKKAGAQKLPDMVCIYPDTAHYLDEKDLLVSLDSYYTDEELDKYVPEFLEAGRLTDGGELKIIPVSKSTELFMYNKTDFDKFASAAGVSIEDTRTMEGLVDVAARYYEWTDAMTPDVPEDGKAFFGRDSLENYIINGSAQLNHPVLSVDDKGQGVCELDKATMKKLWDCYYVPYINGYFGTYGKYRSDDTKIGKIVAMIGSSSGVNFFPEEITLEDDTSYPIEPAVCETPVFEGGRDIEVQQGAGFSVIRSDQVRQYGSVEFLKWLTQKEQNMEFAISANYMPVIKEALNTKQLKKYFEQEEQADVSERMKESMYLCADMVNAGKLWVGKPFEQSMELRVCLADELRNAAENDRMQVIDRMKNGMTRKEAVQSFVSEEYFNSWYQQLVNKTDAIMAE